MGKCDETAENAHAALFLPPCTNKTKDVVLLPNDSL